MFHNISFVFFSVFTLLSCCHSYSNEETRETSSEESEELKEDDSLQMRQPAKSIGCEYFENVLPEDLQENDISDDDREWRLLLENYLDSSWEGEISCPGKDLQIVQFSFGAKANETYYLTPDENPFEDQVGYFLDCEYLLTLDVDVSISSFEPEYGDVVEIQDSTLTLTLQRDSESVTKITAISTILIDDEDWKTIYVKFTIDADEVPRIRIDLVSEPVTEQVEDGFDTNIHGSYCTINNWKKVSVTDME